ncbi:MAG: NlpC/P60 family protein [Candidatus Nanopelagicales bacterium]
MTSYTRAAAGALLLALTSAGIAAPASAVPVLPAEDPAPTATSDPLTAQITETTDQLQTDLTEMRAQQTAAQERYLAARTKAAKLRKLVAANQSAADEARLVVGQYARSIYMNGSTDLSVLASMIDTADPNELMDRADEALRVGDRKDDQYDDAMALLKRNQEVKEQADSAQLAAEASLQTISTQVQGLQRQLADVANQWADHLAGMDGMLDPAQAKANSDAASQWADYLTRLADLRAPSITVDELTKDKPPQGVSRSRKNPGVGTYRSNGDSVTALPDRVIAAVTYAVSTLGTSYQWRKNTDSEMDCSALVDRAWNVPTIPRSKRTNARALVADGVSGLAANIKFIPEDRMSVGDVVFIADPGRGVNHTGIVLDNDTMIAGDARTGGVNAVPIPKPRVWQVGRLSLKPPKRGNFVPKASQKPFQCGMDPADFITTPDGKVLADPRICPPKPAVFSEAHMQPAAITGGRCAGALWPQLTIIGGWRPSDPYPDHPSGRALDIMMPAGCSTDPANIALGTAIAEFFMANAAKFHVQYIIWQQRIWNAETETPKRVIDWRGMSNRGGCTANHQDHVHVSFIGPNTVSAAPAPADTSDDSGPGSRPGSGAGSKSGSDAGKDTTDKPNAPDNASGSPDSSSGTPDTSAGDSDTAGRKRN